MPERILTDSRGQRWDVLQQNEKTDAVFRPEGLEDVGHGGLDVSFDADGYETGR